MAHSRGEGMGPEPVTGRCREERPGAADKDTGFEGNIHGLQGMYRSLPPQALRY